MTTTAAREQQEYDAELNARASKTIGEPIIPAPAEPLKNLPALEPFPTFRVLEGEAPKPPGLLVEDLVVAGDVNVWAGYGGAAKSVAALATAVGVALGHPVFGALRVHRPGVVLIVAPEDGRAEVRMMLDALIAGMELDAAARTLLTRNLVMIEDTAIVNLTTDTRRLARTVREFGAVLVLLDPLRNLLGGADENDNAVAGACLDATRRDLCREAGATVLLLAHIRKPGKDALPDADTSIHELRGAAAWAAGARLVFGVSNQGDRVTLQCLKANRLRADLRHELELTIAVDPAIKTRWTSCTLTDRNAGLASESYTPGIARPLNANEIEALACLDDRQEPERLVSWSAWLKGSGLKDSTFRHVKDRLLNAGLASAVASAKRRNTGGQVYCYRITDTGRAALVQHAE